MVKIFHQTNFHKREENPVEISLQVAVPRVKGLLEMFFQEMGWEFNGPEYPVIASSDCSTHPRLAVRGIGEETERLQRSEGSLEEAGAYRNASYCCGMCYPDGQPIKLEWNHEQVTLSSPGGLTMEAISLMVVFHRVFFSPSKQERELLDHIKELEQKLFG